MDISVKLKEITYSISKRQNIFALVGVLVPLWLVGISGFLFAYPSFRIVNGIRQWTPDFDGIVMTLLLSIAVTLTWILFAHTGKIDKIIEKTKNLLHDIKTKPSKLFKSLIIVAAIVAISTIVAFMLTFIHDESFASRFFINRVLLYTAFGMCLCIILLFHKNPDKLFLYLSLVIGFMYIMMHPSGFYGWDQQIHYAWAVESSFVRYVSLSEAEIANVTWGGRIGITGWYHFEYANVTLHSYRAGTDVITQDAHLYASPSLFTRLAHVFTGIMIFIARSLTLPANIAFVFGLIGNHLIYTMIVYFAIKRLITGKHIMAVIAMFPTAFVLSTTFGYDHWLISLVMLGTAYFIRELQEPDKRIEAKNLIIMIGAFTLAMGPKAVYFPLMLILYFMKRNKFETKKGYVAYMLSVTGAVLFVLSTFILPFIATGGGGEGAGDPRGGDYVSAADQTMFILQNPIIYTETLLGFVRSYLSLHTVVFSSTFFAFLGLASYYFIPWLLLFFVTVTDRGENDALSSTVRNKVIMAILSFGAIVFPATAMYILFTNVGAGYIAGMQPRYVLPILFPFAAIVGGFKINNNINKTAYSCIVFGIMCFMLLNSAWEMFVPSMP